MNKYVINCIQRRFPEPQWSDAIAILTKYCDQTLSYPDVEWKVPDRVVQRWRTNVQVKMLNLSEGSIDWLREHAPDAERQIEKSYTRWCDESDPLRGVEFTGYNNSLTLVRADIDTVGEGFAHKALDWKKNAIGQAVEVDGEFLLLFQFRGNAWTQILSSFENFRPYYSTVLRKQWQRAFSRRLKARVITYGCSDTAGYLGYTLYDSGVLLETMTSLTEKWEEGDAFLTHRCDLTIHDLDDVSPFTISSQLFQEEGAYEPGFQIMDLLNNDAERVFANEMAIVRKPDLTYYAPEDCDVYIPGARGITRLDRVDYIKLA